MRRLACVLLLLVGCSSATEPSASDTAALRPDGWWVVHLASPSYWCGFPKDQAATALAAIHLCRAIRDNR